MTASGEGVGSSRTERLSDFVAWARANITGDEKGEAQIFIDRLFQAFARPGAREVGGTFEERVKKRAGEGKGVSFADYVWKPVVPHRDEKARRRPAPPLPTGVRLLGPTRPRSAALRRAVQLRRVPHLRLRPPARRPRRRADPRRTAGPLGPAGVPLPDERGARLRQRPRGRHPRGGRRAGKLLQPHARPRRSTRAGEAVRVAVARRPLRRGHRPARAQRLHKAARGGERLPKQVGRKLRPDRRPLHRHEHEPARQRRALQGRALLQRRPLPRAGAARTRPLRSLRPAPRRDAELGQGQPRDLRHPVRAQRRTPASGPPTASTSRSRSTS